LRPTDEVLEQLGIEVSERYLKGAHVIIACDDNPAELPKIVDSVSAVGSAPVVAVLTKADRSLVSSVAVTSAVTDDRRPLPVSAHTRTGLLALGDRIERELESRYGVVPVARPALTRARQRRAIEQASDELRAFQRQWETGELPAPVAAVHIRSAIGALDELIGAVDTEDVLSRLFATFCIGK
jgi:tRNA modification GTPase